MPTLFSAPRSLLLRDAATFDISGKCRAIECLEPRRLLSVSIDSAGWTVVAPAADTHIIYVSSSSGKNTNTGLSPGSAVQSIARGESFLRNDSADWMLLKAGDTWNTGLGVWRLSGQSAQDPMLVGSYGVGARPLLNTGANSGLWAASSSSPVVNNLDVVGLHFVASGRVPGSPDYSGPANTTGIDILTKSDAITIEDCQIEDYVIDINLQSFFGTITNASVRRNIIDDSYSTDSHSQGLYAYGVNNLLIEGNTFDANGYNAQVPGAGATYYNHDCYISANNTGVVVDDNIFARAAGYGLQDRPGGIVENNLFIDDPIGMSFGLVNGADTTAGGVAGIVNGNVFVGGANLNGSPYGQGIVLGNTKPGYPTVVSNNIFADGLARAPAAITLTYGIGQIDPQDSVGLNDLRIQDNVVYNWYRGVYIDGGLQPGGTGLKALNDVTISDNDFQNIDGPVIQSQDPIDTAQLHFSANAYSTDPPAMLVQGKNTTFGQWLAVDETGATQSNISFVDPTRTLASYNPSIGGVATDADFLAGAKAQSQQNWNPAYTPGGMIAYMQAGFDDAAAPHDWLAPTPPIVTAVGFPAATLARNASLTFTVTYLGAQSIDVSSLSSGNLTVAAAGYSAAATFVSSTGSGTQVVATYSIAAPKGSFATGHNYRFTIGMNANQVTDNQGFAAQAGPVGTYRLHVLPRPKPPTVGRIQLIHRGQGLAVHFNEDLSASLNVADLVLTSDDGQTVDPSLMTLSWSATNYMGTWAFTGEPGGYLPPGRWHVRILAATVIDGTGQDLDGNRDGLGGDDYVSPRVFPSKGARD